MSQAISHVRRTHKNAVPVSETIEAWVFLAAIAATVYLVKTQAIVHLMAWDGVFAEINAFLAGILYTSILTAVPATYAIAEMGSFMPAWKIALIGGAGSVVGDLIMYRLLRSSLTDHLVRAAVHPSTRRVGKILSSGPFWWAAPFFGAITFATPLPDEIGIAMMGISHLRPSRLVLFAFVTHVIGIYAIVEAALFFT